MVEDVEPFIPTMVQESEICPKSVDGVAPQFMTAAKSSDDVCSSRNEGMNRSFNSAVTPPRKITLKRRRCTDSQDELDGVNGCPTASRRRLPSFPSL